MNIRGLSILAALIWFFVLNAAATVRYVDLNSTNAAPPFTDWTTAATNIQDAVDAAVNGDLILVTNGVYATGGRFVSGNGTNRVVINKAITLQSVNGAAVTVIQGKSPMGNNAVGCVYLTNNATLEGFTLTNGAGGTGGGALCQSASSTLINCIIVSNSAQNGGGVFQGTCSNCTLKWNSAQNGGGVQNGYLIGCLLISNSASFGGGAYTSTLTSCKLLGNSAIGGSGGGAFRGLMTNCLVLGNVASDTGGVWTGNADLLYNCTIVSNTATATHGGVREGVLLNCICYYNTAPSSDPDPNGYPLSISNSCITPMRSGAGNITNAPLFVDPANGDYHLQSNSPCINAGANLFTTGTTNDLDGNPRIQGGTVDMGAFEYQAPTSILSYAWAQQYGLPTDGSVDFADTDGDGMNNWQEWIAGTDPTDPLSVLKMLSPSNTLSGLRVSWQSVTTRTYFLQRATNLAAQPAFDALQSNLIGQAGTTVYVDTTATNGGAYFYRIGVR